MEHGGGGGGVEVAGQDTNTLRCVEHSTQQRVASPKCNRLSLHAAAPPACSPDKEPDPPEQPSTTGAISESDCPPFSPWTPGSL